MNPSGVSSSSSIVCLLLCVATTVLISCTFFLLVSSASQHHDLHSFSYDLIMEKTNSSSVLVFLILNLIIAAILIESPSAYTVVSFGGVKEVEVDQEKEIHGGGGVASTTAPDHHHQVDRDTNNNNNNILHNPGEDQQGNAAAQTDHQEDENGNKVEEDNDLERRIEEFIAKINRRWREELLMERVIMSMECQPS